MGFRLDMEGICVGVRANVEGIFVGFRVDVECIGDGGEWYRCRESVF